MSNRNLAESHGQSIVGEKGTGEQFTLSQEVLDGFCGLYAADDAANGSQYARFFARWHRPGRRHGVKDTAVAWTFARHIGQGLTAEADDAGMGKGGYLRKDSSDTDGRITYLTITDEGRMLSRTYNEQFFAQLIPLLAEISDGDADCTIHTIEKLYQIMSERKISLEYR